MYIALSLLICVIGGVVSLVAANPKYSHLGLVAFGTGLLAFLMRFDGFDKLILR